MNRFFVLATLACVATTATSNAQLLWEDADPGAGTSTTETGGGLLIFGVEADPLGDVARAGVGELYFPGTQKFLNINSGFTGGTGTYPITAADIGRTARFNLDYYFPPDSSFDNLGLDGEGNPISPDLFWVQVNSNDKNVGLSAGFISPLSTLDNPGGWNTLTYEVVIPDMVMELGTEVLEVPTSLIPQIVFADGGFGAGTPNGSITPAMYIDNITFELIDTVVDNFPGDANGDGTVDLLDLDILGSNFGLTGTATFAQGDFNEDTNVDLLDLDILGSNFGNTAAGSAAIPEPTTMAMLALTAMGIVARRR